MTWVLPLAWTVLCALGAVLWTRALGAYDLTFASGLVILVACLLWLSLSLLGWLVWALVL